MKRSLLIILILFPFSVLIQANNYEYLHGLRYNRSMKTNSKEKEIVYFEMSGYEISAQYFKGNISNEKDLNKIKKKFDLKEFVQATYSENKFSWENSIIEVERPIKNNSKAKTNEAYYILQSSDGQILTVQFVTLDQRDFVFEQTFVQDYLNGKLESYISDDWTGEYMNFAGRNIQLGNACSWRSPNNFHCKGGQISWSEFPTLDQSDIHLENKIAANKRDNVMILSEDFIEVVFEDVTTIAHRIAYLEENRYNRFPLIVYYISEEVRGHNICCVMSHYAYNRADYELPDLLEEFMYFPEEPYGAFNKYDIPQYESFTPEEKKHFEEDIDILQIRLGSFIPLGNLKNKFAWAPSIDCFIGFPIQRNMAIDLSFSVAPTIDRTPVEVNADGKMQSTKMEAVVGLGARYRYQKKLLNNVFGSLYGGLGVSILNTDLEKENPKNNKEEYHQVTAFDMYGGVNIRYKKVGCFFEYHHPFYEKSSLTRYNFGNQMLQTGLFYAF